MGWVVIFNLALVIFFAIAIGSVLVALHFFCYWGWKLIKFVSQGALILVTWTKES